VRKIVRGAALAVAAVQTVVALQVLLRDLYEERYARALLLCLLLAAGWAALRPSPTLLLCLFLGNGVYLFL
jgi:hypothetical protein